MKLPNLNRTIIKFLGMAILVLLSTGHLSLAATTDVATAPMESSSTTVVKPNLFFIIDDSGSMQWDYMPDLANEGYCKDTTNGTTLGCCRNDDGTTDGAGYSGSNSCMYRNSSSWETRRGMPPFVSSDFNTLYYNPAITYTPPVDSTAASYPEMNATNTTNWTSVKVDYYQKLTTDSVNLVTGYPDHEWCLASGFTNCLKDTDYSFPNTLAGYYHWKTGNPYYYRAIPGEFCTNSTLSSCTSASSPSGTNTTAAKVRWCSDTGLSTCQAVNTSTFNKVKYPSIGRVSAQATITLATGTTASWGDSIAVTVGATTHQLLCATAPCNIPSSHTTDRDTLGNALRDAINARKEITGFYASYSAGVLTIKAPQSAGNLTVTPSVTKSGRNWTTGSFSGYVAGTPGSWLRTDIVSTKNDYSGELLWTGGPDVRTSRDDCAAKPACTYAEEMTNFANWFTYYRTRIQTMKTGASRAFKTIGSNYRVGFSSINYMESTATPPSLAGDAANDNKWLGVNDFDSAQKAKWYAELFNINPTGNTPLVHALSNAGRMYAGNYGPDPMQYSCQQNFTILTTDGYTNEDTEPYAFQKDGTAYVGNTDGGPTPATAATATIAISGQSGTGSNSCYVATSITVNTGTSVVELLNSPPTPSPCTTNRDDLGNAVASSINARTGTTGFSAIYSGSANTVTITAPATLGNFTATPSATFSKISGTKSRSFTTSAFSGYAAGSTGSAPKPYYDANNASNTLADVAYYYYVNDLRTSTFNTNGVLGTPVDDNNVSGSGNDTAQHQHMTSFTLGLGVDGTLQYAEDYASGGSADYNGIVQGTINWPVPDPMNTVAQNVDDLWHAAVNGRGAYFSAKNPDSLVSGLNKALSGVSARKAAAAAAATSNLEPVAGDNFAYIAVYQTVTWDGNVTAHEIDLSNGSISATAMWSAQSLLDAKAGVSTDSRTIYTFDASTVNKLKAFTWANLTAEAAYFNTNQLNQYSLDWNAATKAVATGETLVNYLRGQNQHEIQDGNTYQLYRDREHVLGDIVHSQPVYVKAPQFNYVDTGYSTFKSNNLNRAPTIYVGANDGMLHAFNADAAASGGGQERWAYIPPAVLPNLYRLADKNYSSNHYYYVDGSPTVGDACNTSLNVVTSLYECPDAASWKTILVGGLNAGGRAFYALDITDPTAPKALWNFNVSNDVDVGLSFGNPIITKRSDGRWVVIVTSGYNNVSPGDGEGHLFVLDAISGAVLDKIDTLTGSTTTPSGLGRINNWVSNVDNDNTTLRIYGGDLLGNVWRFDINDILNPAGKDAFLLATLGTSGSGQPITTKPELGEVNGNSVVFVGSGRYLGTSDLTDASVRSMYAIKDDLGTTSLGNVRSGTQLVQRTLVNTTGTGGEALRTVEGVAASTDFWTTHSGWYIDLPDAGERVNVDAKLVLGTLVFATNVPANNACTVGGYSWIYALDYATGGYISSATAQTAGQKIPSSLVVGLNIIRLPDGRTITIITTADTGHPTYDTPIGAGSISARRVSWRELITE